MPDPGLFLMIPVSDMTTPYASFPAGRPRRLRFDTATRNLVREHSVTAHDFIYPVFVHEGTNLRQPVASMPGVERLSIDLLLPVPPMTPMVWPRLAVKLMSERLGAPAPA